MLHFKICEFRLKRHVDLAKDSTQGKLGKLQAVKTERQLKEHRKIKLESILCERHKFTLVYNLSQTI